MGLNWAVILLGKTKNDFTFSLFIIRETDTWHIHESIFLFLMLKQLIQTVKYNIHIKMYLYIKILYYLNKILLLRYKNHYFHMVLNQVIFYLCIII